MQSNFRRKPTTFVKVNGVIKRKANINNVNKLNNQQKHYVKSLQITKRNNQVQTKTVFKKNGIKFNGLAPVVTDPRVDPPPRSCFNCWKQGHKLRDCKLPKRIKFCDNCGRRGVLVNNCPRCRQAYIQFLQNQRNRQAAIDDDDVDPERDEVVRELLYQDELARLHEEEQARIEAEKQRRLVYETIKKREMMRLNLKKQKMQQERHIGLSIYQELHNREEPDEIRPVYGNWSPEPGTTNGRRKSESPSAWYGANSSSETTSSKFSAPVQEILTLAKSISHLSSETQEIIMRQVIAERKEREYS